MAQIEVVMTSEEAQVWQAMQKLRTGAQQFEKGLSDAAKAAKQLADENRLLEREAKKVWESTRTPMERYMQQLQRLNELHQKGKLDEKTYSRAALDAQREYEKATGSVEKFNEAERRAAEEARKAAQENEKLGAAARQVFESTRTPQERYNARLAEMGAMLKRGKIDQETYNRAVGQARVELDAAGRAGAGAFGARALTDLRNFALGFVSIGSAVAAVVAAMREMEEVRQQAAQDARAASIDMGSLAQVATSGEHFQELTGQARQLFASGGAATQQEAAQTVFMLQSAGQIQNLDLVGQMRATGLVADPTEMVRSAATLMSSMGGDETGSMRDVFSKAFGASAFTTTSVEELLRGAARAGTGGRAIGLSDEEVLAATAIMAEATGSGEMGGTRIQSLTKSLTKMGASGQFDFKGKSLQQMLSAVSAAGMSDDDLIQAFGSDEALQAYRVLSLQQDKYGQALAGVNAAQVSDEVGKRLGYAGGDPATAAALVAKRAEAARKVSETGLGTGRNFADALIEDRVRQVIEGGGSEADAYGVRKSLTRSRWAMGDREFSIRNRDLGSAETRAAIDQWAKTMPDLVNSIKQADEQLKRLSNTAGKMNWAGTTLSRPDIDK